jgi:hypothetical protein
MVQRGDNSCNVFLSGDSYTIYSYIYEVVIEMINFVIQRQLNPRDEEIQEVLMANINGHCHQLSKSQFGGKFLKYSKKVADKINHIIF